MDQHPIPQDVTGFQFKLIGSMTVKQFGYIASGCIMAVLIFYLPKMHVLAKVILIPLFGIGGVVTAFVPIEGRPIDTMAKNFFRAVFSPNQYAYRRSGRKMSFSHIADAKEAAAKAAAEAAKKATKTQKVKVAPPNQKEEQLRALLLNSHHNSKSTLDSKESAFLTNISTVAAPIQKNAAVTSPLVSSGIPQHTEDKSSSFLNKINPAVSQPSVPSAPTPIPAPQQIQAQIAQPASSAPAMQPAPSHDVVTQSMLTKDEKRDTDLSTKEAQLEKELIAARQAEVQSSSTDPATGGAKEAHQKVTALEIQIQEVHQQKQQLEEEIAKLKNQLAAQQAAPISQPASAATPPAPASPPPAAVARQDAAHVRSVPQALSKSVGLPHVSDTPNVIVGIVKDPRGNVLPNILIEVKDKDNNPVRAFKTSPLGQFASATPLPEGTYTIVLEDPKKTQTFDTVQIIANNQIMLPIEIISHDAREELRKQLFN